MWWVVGVSGEVITGITLARGENGHSQSSRAQVRLNFFTPIQNPNLLQCWSHNPSFNLCSLLFFSV